VTDEINFALGPSKRLRHLVIGTILFGFSLSYIFVSVTLGSPSTELYALQAASFLRGKASLPIEPPPRLLSLHDPYNPVENQLYRLQDASLFNGHYYLYFGVVPVVTLFLPYRLVTGLDLPNRVALPIFCVGGFLSSCALFFSVARRSRWALPLWMECIAIISLGSMSLVCLLLRRPSIYEVAISAGYCFVMTGFLVMAEGFYVSRRGYIRLFLAGLMLGLAVGCRPHLIVICGIVLLAFAIHARHSPGCVIAMASGMLVCGAALGWYNYARFDDPLEFGRSYQLTSFASNRSAAYGLELNPDSFFRSAEEFLFLPPHIDTHPPYLHSVLINPLPSRPGPPLWTEDMVGLVPVAPFALLGFFMPLFLGRHPIGAGFSDEGSVWLLYTMYWSGVAVFLTLCTIGWVLGRYLVDFTSLLTFEGISVMALSWRQIHGRGMKSVFSWGVSAATVYGALSTTALEMHGGRMILKFLGSAARGLRL
jgi:hypothetical protein